MQVSQPKPMKALKGLLSLDDKQPKPMKAQKGPNKQQQLMSLADRFSTYTGKGESDDDIETVTSSEDEAALKRPAAAMKRPGAVDESTHSDRLKKAAWKRAEARGEIPPETIEAHAKANRNEKREIINNGIMRLPDGSYQLALGKSATLNQAHHVL